MNIKKLQSQLFPVIGTDFSYYPVKDLSVEQAKTFLTSIDANRIFGLEFHKGNISLIAPVCYPMPFKLGHRDFKKLDGGYGFSIRAKKATCFPFKLDVVFSFINAIEKLNTSVVYQLLLIKQEEKWKVNMAKEFQQYLRGNDNPSSNPIVRKVQNKILDVIEHYSRGGAPNGRYEFEEAKQKIKEEGFRYAINLHFYQTTENEVTKSILELKKELFQHRFTNEWVIEEKDRISHIVRHKLSSNFHIASTTELLPFLISDSGNKPTLVEVKKEEVVEVVKTNSFGVFFPPSPKLKITADHTMANKIRTSLKALHILKEDQELRVKKIDAGPTIQRITFELPENIKLSKLLKEDTMTDIRTHIGVKKLTILQGEGNKEVCFDVPQKNRAPIFLRDFLDSKEFENFREKHPLPFFVGIDEVGKPLYACLAKAIHLLVAGTTGSGKSVWLNQLILTLLLACNEEKVHLYLVDPKQVELAPFEDFPQTKKLVTTSKEALDLLLMLREEVTNRYQQFKKQGVRNIEGFINKGFKMPYIVVVLDEYSDLSGSAEGDEINATIQSLSQIARASGVHLVIATQRPTVKNIPGEIKACIPSKIGFSCSSNKDFTVFLNSVPPFKLLGNGDGVMALFGQHEEFIRFQGPLLVHSDYHSIKDEDLIEQIGKKLKNPTIKDIFEAIPAENEITKEVVKPDSQEEFQSEDLELEELEVEVPTAPPDKLTELKVILAHTKDSRQRQTREKMNISSQELKDLMKQLVTEGWLEEPPFPKAGYKIIATEEEMEEVRRKYWY